jgi:hypothetical protein
LLFGEKYLKTKYSFIISIIGTSGIDDLVRPNEITPIPLQIKNFKNIGSSLNKYQASKYETQSFILSVI